MTDTRRDIPQPNHAALMAELKGLRELTEARFNALEGKVDTHSDVAMTRLNDHSKRIRETEKGVAVHRWLLRGAWVFIVMLAGKVGIDLTGVGPFVS